EEGGGLPGPRLGLAAHVDTLDCLRDEGGLDRRRLAITRSCDGREDGRGEIQGLETICGFHGYCSQSDLQRECVRSSRRTTGGFFSGRTSQGTSANGGRSPVFHRISLITLIFPRRYV